MSTPKFVEIETIDGLTLPGLFYEAGNSKKAAIYLHGNGSSSVFYNHAEKKEFAEIFIKNNISFLYFNNRGAHILKKLSVKKDGVEERKSFGTAFEIIKECVFDIDGAIAFLTKLGYTELYLIGSSTGANKICVYHYYKPKNSIAKYILLSGGDDIGIYFNFLGEKKYKKILAIAKEKVMSGKGDEISKELLSSQEVFSYKGFYDIANPDGDYNCFPFYEVIYKKKLSKKPLFRYYKTLNKPSLVVYGELDEYVWGDAQRVVDMLKKQKPAFTYEVMQGADHGFSEHKKKLAELIVKWL